MKTYGGVDVEIHIFLTSELVGEWSGSRLGHFTPGERAPGTHWIGGWVDSRVGLDDAEKILDPTGTRPPTLGRPARSQSLYRLSYPGSYLKRANTSKFRSRRPQYFLAYVPHIVR
jgi:hypothetical protein